jgi:hypothetical protein
MSGHALHSVQGIGIQSKAVAFPRNVESRKRVASCLLTFNSSPLQSRHQRMLAALLAASRVQFRPWLDLLVRALVGLLSGILSGR